MLLLSPEVLERKFEISLNWGPKPDMKSVNLKYITVGRLDDDMIVPPSDGPMFILINWE